MDEVPIPPAVVAALEGTPSPETWEPAHLLLTVNEDLLVDVCLLSRAEAAVDGAYLDLAIASRRATANIRRSHLATLLVHAEEFWCLQLRRERILEYSGMAGGRFRVLESRREDIGVALRPLSYSVAPWLSSAERWDVSAAVLSQLRSV